MEPSKPLEEWTTPELVREYAEIRVNATLLYTIEEKLNANQRAWLSEVVDELRKRDVLD